MRNEWQVNQELLSGKYYYRVFCEEFSFFSIVLIAFFSSSFESLYISHIIPRDIECECIHFIKYYVTSNRKKNCISILY